MSRFEELTREVCKLPERERAAIAVELLSTLPPGVSDEDDDGLEEALRRAAELDADPSIGIRWADLKQELGR